METFIGTREPRCSLKWWDSRYREATPRTENLGTETTILSISRAKRLYVSHKRLGVKGQSRGGIFGIGMKKILNQRLYVTSYSKR